MPSIPDTAFRLKWRRTWSHPQSNRDDFVASDGASFCRIYKLAGGPHDGQWLWTCARTYQIASGHADSAREAALAAESAYLPAE